VVKVLNQHQRPPLEAQEEGRNTAVVRLEQVHLDKATVVATLLIVGLILAEEAEAVLVLLAETTALIVQALVA